MKTDEISQLQKILDNPNTTKQEYIRLKAVQLKRQGYKRTEIADILSVSLSAIRDWIRNYNKNGVVGLRTKKRKNSPTAKLTIEQKDTIRTILGTEQPSDVGFKGNHWDVKTLAALIKKKFHVVYKGTRSYQRMLTYCGYSYQRVEIEDVRKNKQETDGFKLRFKKKSRRGIITMSW